MKEFFQELCNSHNAFYCALDRRVNATLSREILYILTWQKSGMQEMCTARLS